MNETSQPQLIAFAEESNTDHINDLTNQITQRASAWMREHPEALLLYPPAVGTWSSCDAQGYVTTGYSITLTYSSATLTDDGRPF